MQQDKFEELRRKAEEMLRNAPSELTREQTDMAEVLHELAVHQAELETQNDELRQTQQKLQQSKNNYFDLYEYAPVGYLNMSTAGVIKSINLAATRMFDRPRNELLHRAVSDFLLPLSVSVFYQHLNDVLMSLEALPAELSILRPDKTAMEVRVHTVYPGIAWQGEQTVRMAMVDITELNQARQKLNQLNAELEKAVEGRTALANQRLEQAKSLNLDLIRAEQRERQRLAEIVHENLQQLLVSSQFNLSVARKSAKPAERHDFLNRTEETLKKAMDISRSLSHELYPPLLYQSGLTAALTWYAGQMKKQHNMDVQLDIPSPMRRFPTEIEIFLFQCARELLLNSLRHGKVGSARIGLDYNAGAITLHVTDKGAGFDCRTYMEQDVQREGFGLAMIKQRIETMGGTFEVVSEPGDGCRVTLTLPSMPETAEYEAIAEGQPKTKEPAAKPKPHTPIRVMLVDDHEILRRGLVRLLERQKDIEIVAEAGDGLAAIEQARLTQPDVILMDIGMPIMDGIEATERIVKEDNSIRVIALTLHEEEWMLDRMLEAGASRYLTKTIPPEELIEAIRDAASLEPIR